jgi:hypothetical protein
MMGGLVGLVILLMLGGVAQAQSAAEWRAMENRTGVTRENACFLLALDLDPSSVCDRPDNRPRVPVRTDERRQSKSTHD